MVRNLSVLKWLRLDALNRAWRTTLQGALATVGVAAIDAAYQVLQHAFGVYATGAIVDWSQVGDSAWVAARVAAVMAVLAYVHRRGVDPSRVPSAAPPAPPATLPDVAEAGAMNAGRVRA